MLEVPPTYKGLAPPFHIYIFKATHAAQRTRHLTRPMLWAVGGAVVKLSATWRMRNANARSAPRVRERERETERKRCPTTILAATSEARGMWHA